MIRKLWNRFQVWRTSYARQFTNCEQCEVRMLKRDRVHNFYCSETCAHQWQDEHAW